MKNNYEFFVVLSSKISASEQDAFLDKFEKIMESNKVDKTSRDDWGKRALAYEIKGQNEARYILYQLKSPPEAIKELERNCRLDERVIRYLAVKSEKVKSVKTARKSARKGAKGNTSAKSDKAAEPKAREKDAEGEVAEKEGGNDG